MPRAHFTTDLSQEQVEHLYTLRDHLPTALDYLYDEGFSPSKATLYRWRNEGYPTPHHNIDHLRIPDNMFPPPDEDLLTAPRDTNDNLIIRNEDELHRYGIAHLILDRLNQKPCAIQRFMQRKGYRVRLITIRRMKQGR